MLRVIARATASQKLPQDSGESIFFCCPEALRCLTGRSVWFGKGVVWNEGLFRKVQFLDIHCRYRLSLESELIAITNTDFILPALLQKLVGEFFFDFSQGNLENLVGNLEGIFRGFFLTHRTKAQNFRENSGAFFVRKFVARKKNLSCKIHSADVPP